MTKAEHALAFMVAAGMDDLVDALGQHIGPETGMNRLAEEIHKIAKEHGWYDAERPFPELVAMMHSELSEALEAYRKDEALMWFSCKLNGGDEDACEGGVGRNCAARSGTGEICTHAKPEGIGIELADCIIRVLDACAYMGVDVERAIRVKMEYNRGRSYRHGGKKC